MEKEAWVVAVEDGEVRLRYMRHGACRHCGACFVLGKGPGEEEVILPENQLDLRKGDRVAVGLPSTSLLKASFLVYTIPLIFFFLGYLAGAKISAALIGTAAEEAGGMIGGVLALVLTYWGLHYYDRRLRKSSRYQPQVIRIVERATQDYIE
ncbi:MAG TPA: SoxR reducing system RseC family protein [Firmicutes bacterium]|nr:SoxR reducing system RseC family protein [Bacillota bacterium]